MVDEVIKLLVLVDLDVVLTLGSSNTFNNIAVSVLVDIVDLRLLLLLVSFLRLMSYRIRSLTTCNDLALIDTLTSTLTISSGLVVTSSVTINLINLVLSRGVGIVLLILLVLGWTNLLVSEILKHCCLRCHLPLHISYKGLVSPINFALSRVLLHRVHNHRLSLVCYLLFHLCSLNRLSRLESFVPGILLSGLFPLLAQPHRLLLYALGSGTRSLEE